MEQRAFIRYQNQGDPARPDMVADAVWLVRVGEGIDVRAVDRDAEVRSLAQLEGINGTHPEAADAIRGSLSNGATCVFSEVSVLGGDTIDTLYQRYILNGLAGTAG